jgi:hypothetical protein
MEHGTDALMLNYAEYIVGPVVAGTIAAMTIDQTTMMTGPEGRGAEEKDEDLCWHF